MMAVTLRDVGRRAGVSAMTVSRVINGRAAAPARNGTPTKGRWGGFLDLKVCRQGDIDIEKILAAGPISPRADTHRSITGKDDGGLTLLKTRTTMAGR
jgi:hypothetical protein